MLKSIIEALLFAAGKGLTYAEIYNYLAETYYKELIDSCILELKAEYSGDKGVILIEYNDTLQFQSNPKYGSVLADILTPIKEKELSKTLLEVLAIIAYKQPITKLDIENIRGVSSEYACSVLMKINLIDIVGRKDTIGRPVLYGVTDEFLKKFKLKSLKELPDYEELLNKIRNNFDKYYAQSDGLYRERNIESEQSTNIVNTSKGLDSGTVYFENEDESEIPDFLKGEDYIKV